MHLNITEHTFPSKQVQYKVIFPNLTETNFAIKVFVNFLDHLFEAEVSLWCTKLLHHMFKLFEVNKLVSTGVISVQINNQGRQVSAMPSYTTILLHCYNRVFNSIWIYYKI